MSFNAQVKSVINDSWIDNDLYFATENEALSYASDLQTKWRGCKSGEANRQVTESDKPVSHLYVCGHLITAPTDPSSQE